MKRSPTVRMVVTTLLCGLAFEFVAFSDFDGAHADDMTILTQGGGSASIGYMPPTILFLFDTSGSMNNLACDDSGLPSWMQCTSSKKTTVSAPNSSTICGNSVFDGIYGPDMNGDGNWDHYIAPYKSDGVTYNTDTARYPIYDTRSTTNLFETGSTYRPSVTNNSPAYALRKTGTGTTVQDKIDSAITQECAAITDCKKRARCVYSFRTRGYYWEPASSTCATGDPSGLCGSCGTNTIESPEVCDGTALNGKTCVTQGFTEGTLKCAIDCKSFDTTNCSICGNNLIKGTEVCDGTALNGKTCVTQGYDSGTLSCASNCKSFDTSLCVANPVCGDNHAQGTEQCDGSDLKSETCETRGFVGGGTLTCYNKWSGGNSCKFNTSACVNHICGNDIAETAEACDGADLKSETCTTRGHSTGTLGCLTDCSDFNYSLCGKPLGKACTAGSQCSSGFCTGSVCSTCGNDNDCSGNRNDCVRAPGCWHYYCSDDSCTESSCSRFTARALGSCCTRDSDCTSGKCYGGVCSACKGGRNDTCSGRNNSCEGLATCAYYKCSADSCSVAPPAGGGGGAGGAGIATVAASLARSMTSSFGSNTAFSDYPVMLGDWFNFYPPKGVGVIGAFKKVTHNLKGDARVGILDFGDIGATNVSLPVSPACTAVGADCKDGTSTTKCFDPDSTTVTTYLNGVSFGSNTPLSQALDRGAKEFAATGTGTVPICDATQTCGASPTNLVFITDGLPNGDASSTADIPYIANRLTGLTKTSYASNAPDDETYADEVAHAMTTLDMRTDLSGTQHVNTSVVSFGVVSQTDPTLCAGLLAQTAAGGGGTCVVANNASELEFQLGQILGNIVERSVGFTSPSVSTTRVNAASVLSNASFRPVQSFALWEGHVFGLQVCDKGLALATGESCTCPNTSDQMCVTDSLGHALSYDSVGHLGATPFWDAQLCLSGDVSRGLGSIPEDYGDNNVNSCYRTADETSTNPLPRKILTAVERAGASDTLTVADQIAFTLDNLEAKAYSAAFITALNVGNDLARAKALVGFYRGLDTSDLDQDGNRTEDRNLNTIRDGSDRLQPGWWKLGDIFHSIPNTIERPTGKGVGAWGNTASYKAFATDNTSRAKAILVGANDGMLHAFHAGTWNASANNGQGAYDSGTGAELWAFISPELLPKLVNLCDPASTRCNSNSHQYFVDGSVMVRDIWNGGTADKNVASNKDKWKTVAIYGHRGGGATYVALDITDINNPSLLWTFPQEASVDGSGTRIKTMMGQTWLDVFPAPASIGPIQVQGGSGGAYDQWIVLLSAGFDQLDAKGRALFMLDAWTGDIVWMAQKTSTGVTTDMKYSFPATPVFYTQTGSAYPYIAGIVAADHGGQIWHVPTPGPATATSGRYSFTPSIFFRTQTTLINTDSVGGDADSILDTNEYQTQPFFFAPTLTRHAGVVRIIIGTGDRDLLSPEPGLASGIKTAVCETRERLYAIDLLPCSTNGTVRPCYESDLQEVIKDGTTWVGAAPSGRGWYYRLLAGEKVSTPFDILNGTAMYTTFRPTAACGVSNLECSTGLLGEATLYARNYLTGLPLDWNGDNVIASTEERISLGSGVPTAPATSSAVAGGTVTPTVFAGGSDTGIQTHTAAGMTVDLVMEILQFPVSRGTCTRLH